MKNLLTLTAMILIGSGCTQKPSESHTVEMGLFTTYMLFPEVLNGPVKEVIEKTYYAYDENGIYIKGDQLTIDARDSVAWTLDFVVEFNKNGTLLKHEDIDEKGVVLESRIMTIKDRRIIQVENIKEDTIRRLSKLTYDEAGFISKIEGLPMFFESMIDEVLVTSDENGNFTEWQLFNEYGKPTGKFVFTVNENGKRTGYKYYNAKGELRNIQQLDYNEMGFLAKYTSIDSDTNIITMKDYIYDSKGNWISYVAYDNMSDYLLFIERSITYHED